MTNISNSPSQTFRTKVGYWLRMLDPQITGLFLALLFLVVIIGVQTPDKFFRPVNLLNIGLAITAVGLVAIAQTVIIISGGLDISVGSVVAISGVAAAFAMQAVPNVVFGVIVGLLVGALAGLINGLVITYGRIIPVIATLGTLSIFRGIAFIATNANPVGVVNKDFNALGSGWLFGILPVPVLILIIVWLVAFIFLKYTDIGRNVFVMGGNPLAARLAGISLNRYKIGLYTVCGLITGLAGVVMTARANSGQPNAGIGLELESITGAVLGGTVMAGGRGGVVGTLLGVLIIGTLNNGMILLGVPTFYQQVARGLLLVIAMLLQNTRIRK